MIFPNFCRHLFAFVFKLCVTLLLIPFVALCLLILLPYKTFVYLCAKIFRPDLSYTVPFFSNSFDLENTNKNVKMNIGFVTVFDGPLSVDNLVELFDARVIKKRKSNGEFVYKELSMYWTTFLNYWFWKKDPEFDLRNHVRLYDYGGKAEDFELRLPSGEEGFCDEEHLRQVMSPLLAKSWQPKRSPWELLLVQNFRRHVHHGDAGCESKPCSVLIFRVHHGLCDGYSFIKCIVRDLLDTPLKVQINFPKMTRFERILFCTIFPIKVPWDVAGLILNFSTCIYTTSNWNFWRKGNKPSWEGYTSISKPIDCQLIKNIKNKYGVGYNSVLFSVASGALKKVMEEVGQTVPEDAACFYPIALPKHPDGLVNHASLYIFKLKIGQRIGEEVRLREVEKEMPPSKYYTVNHTTPMLCTLSSLLPNSMLKLSTYSAFTMGMTSLPIAIGPCVFSGCEIQMVDAFFAVWPGVGSTGTMGAMLSFNGKQRLVMIIDRTLFPDEKVFKKWGEFVGEELVTLASLMNKDSDFILA